MLATEFIDAYELRIGSIKEIRIFERTESIKNVLKKYIQKNDFIKTQKVYISSLKSTTIRFRSFRDI